MTVYLVVDKDGTEKITNNYPVRGDTYEVTNHKYGIGHPEPKKFKGMWFNGYSDGYFQVPIFTGVVLPKGSIQKLIGKIMTWSDNPHKVEFTL